MSYIKTVFFLILFFIKTPIIAQNNFTGYLEPQLAINHKVSSLYSTNYSLSTRTYFYKTNATSIHTRQVDLSHFSELKTASNQSIAIGILYRFRTPFENEKENELRITQQYNYRFKTNTIRYGHRARAEQRISPSITTHRLRYRFTADMPLQGEKLDIGEPYFIASTESLMSVAKSRKPSYDQRFSSQIGYLLGTNTKIQFGLEYRIEGYNKALSHVLLINSSLVLAL